MGKVTYMANGMLSVESAGLLCFGLAQGSNEHCVIHRPAPWKRAIGGARIIRPIRRAKTNRGNMSQAHGASALAGNEFQYCLGIGDYCVADGRAGREARRSIIRKENVVSVCPLFALVTQ